MSRDSKSIDKEMNMIWQNVSTVTRLRTGSAGLNSRQGRWRYLFLCYSVRPVLRPTVLYPVGTRGYFPGVKADKA